MQSFDVCHSAVPSSTNSEHWLSRTLHWYIFNRLPPFPSHALLMWQRDMYSIWKARSETRPRLPQKPIKYIQFRRATSLFIFLLPQNTPPPLRSFCLTKKDNSLCPKATLKQQGEQNCRKSFQYRGGSRKRRIGHVTALKRIRKRSARAWLNIALAAFQRLQRGAKTGAIAWNIPLTHSLYCSYFF